MAAKYICFDFETGGTTPSKNPILTGYFLAVDQNLSIIDELELNIKPSDPFSLVEEEALQVNKINLEKHISSNKAVERSVASQMLMDFLSKNGGSGKRDKNRPKPLGHNISFDISFIPQLLDLDKWNEKMHYGFVDTFVLSNVLKDAGILPETVGNLGSLVKHFDLKMRDAHNAKEDVLMTLDLYKQMVSMLKSGLKQEGALYSDILSVLEK